METKQTYKSTLLNEAIPKEIDRYLDYSMTVTRIITEKLRSESISQKEFAKSLGKKESQVSEWLSGRHNFTLRTLADISAKYELDFSDAFKLAIKEQLYANPFESMLKEFGKALVDSKTLYFNAINQAFKQDYASDINLNKTILETIINGVENENTIISDESTSTATITESDATKSDPKIFQLVA